MAQVKKQVARLLEVTESLAASPFTHLGRASAAAIGASLQGLTLTPGPADTTAQFDVERLFVAFDALVREEPDRGLVDDLVDTAFALDRLGGDLDAYGPRGLDAVDAIAAEVDLLHLGVFHV